VHPRQEQGLVRGREKQYAAVCWLICPASCSPRRTYLELGRSGAGGFFAFFSAAPAVFCCPGFGMVRKERLFRVLGLLTR
jgi:hypothetical protein